MQNVFTLIFCAIAVSLDSFVVGFSVALKKKTNLTLPVAVCLVTFVLCLVTNTLGVALRHHLDNFANLFGATLLFLLALNNLKHKEETLSLYPITLKQCFAVGFSVGMDGAVANLTIVPLGFGIIAPIVFALTHFLTVFWGQKMASKMRLSNTNKLSALILFALAIAKIVN